jgi:hypothetical protein
MEDFAPPVLALEPEFFEDTVDRLNWIVVVCVDGLNCL